MKFQFKRKNAIRRNGDMHRNNAEWRQAADAYAVHLAEHPDDGPIWVQLGHCEKEAGDLRAAERAYRRAVQLMPNDADVLLHLGHLLRRQSRKADALDVFRAQFRLQPSLETMQQVRELITRAGRDVLVARPGTIVFALEDFFHAFERHATTTGIQRVQAGVIRAAIADAALDTLFVISGRDEHDAPALFRLERQGLVAIVDYASGEVVDHPVLQMMLMEARLLATPLSLGAGCTIVHLGAFWGEASGIAEYLVPLRRSARLVLFVHDVIPVTHLEYCDANLSRVFWQRLSELLYAADLVLTNSDHTQAELKRFMAAFGVRDIPMSTVPLAHAQDDQIPKLDTRPRSRSSNLPKRYVAYVSTIEGRKNHIYVVRAWQRMIAEKVDVPDLLLVGRPGWKADELMALLASTGNLGGRVHIINGLSDGELDAVYRGAQFTVFTSFAEGWGLPVGESLSRGVPCVAARAGAIPEVGGEFVDYIDPLDLDDGVAVFRRMIEDDAYRSARQRAIRERFVPRRWQDVGTDVIDAVVRHVAASAAPRSLPTVMLREGVMIDPGDIQSSIVPVGEQLAHPMSLALAGSFYEAERHGAWMRGDMGELTFGTSADADEPIVVFLKISAAPWATGRRFSASFASSRAPRRWLNLSPGGDLIRLEGRTDAQGRCTVLFAYEGEMQTPPGDNRHIAIALNAIGYARKADAAPRLTLREQFLFNAAA